MAATALRHIEGPGLRDRARACVRTLAMMKMPIVHRKNATVGRANTQSAIYLMRSSVLARGREVALSPMDELTSCATGACNIRTDQE